MKTSAELKAFFWLTAALTTSLMIMGNPNDAADPFLIISSAALFASLIAEQIERQD